MSTLLWLSGLILSGTCCYIVGFQLGRRHGQDEQWVDDMMAFWRRDAARRDKYGRFKVDGGGN